MPTGSRKGRADRCGIEYARESFGWTDRDDAIQAKRYGEVWTKTHIMCCRIDLPRRPSE